MLDYTPSSKVFDWQDVQLQNDLQSRVMLVGECVPSSCGAEGLQRLLSAAEVAAAARAAAAGLVASIQTLQVRPIPGDYDLFADVKFQILGYTLLFIYF